MQSHIPTCDLQILQYTSTVPDALLCSICREVFVDPVQLPCDHHYCRKCLDQHVHQNSDLPTTCPLCRDYFEVRTDIKPANRIIREVLDSLVVHCPHTGCGLEFPRYAIQAHISEYCPGALILCPDVTCDHTVRRDQFHQPCQHKSTTCEFCNAEVLVQDLGLHINLCDEASFECTGCSNTVQHKSRDQHSEQDCEAVPRHCKAAKIGCTFESVRLQVADHEKTCTMALLLPFLEPHERKEEQFRQQLLFEKHAQEQLFLDMAELRAQNAEMHESIAAVQHNRRSLDLNRSLGSNHAVQERTARYQLEVNRQGEILENHADIIDLLQHNVATELRDMRATIDVAIRGQIMNVENHLLELQSGMFAMRNEMRAIAPLLHRSRMPLANVQQQPAVSSNTHQDPDRVVRREDPKL